MDWQHEIVELHNFFEAYYLGRESSLTRAEEAFHPEFTFVGPNGETADRAATMGMIRNGHGHTEQVRITTTDHQLHVTTDELLVASFVERHELSRGENERLVTVVFAVDDDAPNGVRWLRVHETWLSRTTD